MSKKIGKLMLFSSTAIHNASTSEKVSKAIAMFGYSPSKLKAGKSLLATVEKLVALQKKAYGLKLGAYQVKTNSKDIANEVYIPYVKIARIALKSDKGAFQALELHGKRKRGYVAWLAQAKTFYTNVLANQDYKAAMANFGITQKKLLAALNLVIKADDALAHYKKATGEAQNATERRNIAIKALEEWMKDFIAIAKIALEDQPQMMEVLGVIVPS